LLGWQGGDEKMTSLLSSWRAADPILLRPAGQLSCPCGPSQNQFFLRSEQRVPLILFREKAKDELVVTAFKGTIGVSTVHL
jgi:hypothetical protein